MAGPVFSQIFLGVIYVSTVTFQLDLVIVNGDWNIILVILAICMSFGTIFVYSFTGSLVTSSLLQCADDTYDVLWYRFPANVQKILIIILMEAQKPLRFHAYKIAYMNFEIFMKVRSKI